MVPVDVLDSGRHAGRTRWQRGWVEETGKKVKNWRGHYYVYVRMPDGTERRSHRTLTLGPKAQMRKSEAERKLQQIIEIRRLKLRCPQCRLLFSKHPKRRLGGSGVSDTGQ